MSTKTETHERIENRRPPWLLRLLKWKIVIPLLIFSVILAGLGVYRGYLLSQVPDIGDPFDIEEFENIELDDQDNAKFDYVEAVKLLKPMPTIVDKSSEFEEVITNKVLQHALDHGWLEAAPEIRKWVEENRPALERWKQGTEKPDFRYLKPSEITDELSNDLDQWLRDIREFKYLVRLESSRLLAGEGPESAWTWARALLRRSRHHGQHGGTFERISGMDYHAHSLRIVTQITDHPLTSEALLLEMLAEIQRLFEKTPPISTSVKWEYLNVKKSLLTIDADDDYWSSTEWEMGHYQVYYFMGIEPRLSLLVAKQNVANVLDQADIPLRDRQPVTTKLELFARDPKKSYCADILSPSEIERMYDQTILLKNMKPNFSGLVVINAFFEEQARQYSHELYLALKIFHRRFDRYPESLNELVEQRIINAIPIDPLSRTGEPMRYRQLEDEAYVWSTGTNGIDDGGMEIDSDIGSRQQLDIGLVLRKHPKDDSVEAKKP